VQATPERLAEGQRVYEEACARCHASGAEGAPRVGDGEAWKGRSMLWEAVLFEHADKGWLAMPARGGDPVLDSADVEVAAEYMLHLTFPSMPGD
jgi:cytochrome c5